MLFQLSFPTRPKPSPISSFAAPRRALCRGWRSRRQKALPAGLLRLTGRLGSLCRRPVKRFQQYLLIRRKTEYFLQAPATTDRMGPPWARSFMVAQRGAGPAPYSPVLAAARPPPESSGDASPGALKTSSPSNSGTPAPHDSRGCAHARTGRDEPQLFWRFLPQLVRSIPEMMSSMAAT